VARDRKRAKQRRDRAAAGGRRGASGRASNGAQAVSPSQPLRGDLPGALDHASAEVDEFDAALVRGAGGVPVAPESDELTEADQSDFDFDTGDALQEPEGPSGPGGTGGGGVGGGGGGGGEGERPSGAPLRGGNRAIGFLRASWAELQRVQWPDRRQVTQATAVVLGFVTIAGVYLGVADTIAKEIVEFIL
jgi:preprotein translocase SecE subunit